MNISYYLLLAIATVESGNDPTKVNHAEDAYGLFQVRQPVLDDVNADNQLRSLGFTLKDCLEPRLAQMVFRLYISYWASPSRLGRIATDEDIARIWNGGPSGHKRAATIPYWYKVRKELEKFNQFYEYTENKSFFE